jgi:tyrosine type site-specific recombinase
MGKLLEQLKSYFENTPKEILERESAEWDYLNEIGPDVLEYADMLKGYIGTEMEYNRSDDFLSGNYRYFTVPTDDIDSKVQYGRTA